MIPLANLKLICNIPYISILDISVYNVAGAHGTLKVRLLVDYENTSDAAGRLNGSGIRLADNKDMPIFSGICTNIALIEAAEYREIEIEAKSHSILADVEKEMNTYQSTTKTLLGMMQETYGEYGASLSIDEDVTIPFILSQKNETDWEFLKRIAAQYGKQLFIDTRVDKIQIAIGEPQNANQKIEYRVIGSHKDVHSMRTDMAALQMIVSPAEYEIIDAETERLAIAPGDMVNGFRVIENKLYNKNGLMINQIALQYPGAVRTNPLESHNVELENQILTGKVEQVEGNRIKVSFESDKGSGETPWIPYENAINNSFYCMPDEGDEVYVYYDNTGNAVCLGSTRSDISDENFQNAEEKSMSFQGKMIKLGTDKLLIQSLAGMGTTAPVVSKVSFIEEGEEAGIEISSNLGVTLEGVEKLELLAAEDSEFTAMDDVKADFIDKSESGTTKYEEDGGRGTFDKIGLSFISASVKAGQDLLNSIKSTFYIDVIEQHISPAKGDNDYEESNKNAIPQGTVEISSPNAIKLYVDDNNKIEIGEMIQITTPRFEWLGTEKQIYDQVSVEQNDIFDSLLDVVQLSLDIMGMFPVFGAVPDLLNAGISLARGDFVGAGLSLFSAIPAVGDAAGACKIVKDAAKIKDGIESFVKAHKALRYGIMAIKTGACVGLGSVRIVDGMEKIENREGTSDLQDTIDTILLWANGILDAVGIGMDIGEALSESTSTPKGNKNRKTEEEENVIIQTDDNNEENKKGGGKRNEEHAGDPVNMVTGSLTLHHTDMKYNDILGKFSLVRTYESVYTNPNQLLGSKWIYNIESRLYRTEEKVTVRVMDNHLEYFQKVDGIWRNERKGDCLYVLTEEENGYELFSWKEKKKYRYNADGQLIFIADRNGNRTKFSYHDKVLSKMELASGQFLKFSYDGKKLKCIEDNIQRKITFEYEGEFLTKVHYPNDASVQYAYDAVGNIISVWDENGKRYITNQYDRKNRVIKQNLVNGEEYIYLYDDVSKVNTIITASNNRTVKYEYNRKQLVTGIVYPDQTREEKEYDESDNLICFTNRMGYVTRYQYDKHGYLIKQENPDNMVISNTYDDNGNLVYAVDTAGREKWCEYDGKGNLLSIRSKLEPHVFLENKYEYDSTGRLTAFTDGNGNCTQYTYDGPFSMPTSVTEADGRQQHYNYDAAGRLMMEDNGIAIMRYTYNQFDFRTALIDEEGNTTKFVYDLACNLVKVIQPKAYKENGIQGAGIEYQYDGMQHLTEIIHPCGEVYAVKVNSDGAAIKEIHPNVYKESRDNGAGIENTYDTDGNKTHIRYPDGGIRRLKYNAIGLLTKDIMPEAYQPEPDDGAGCQYEYDCMGRLTQITDVFGMVTKRYIYDQMGNVIKEINAKGMMTGTSDEERIGTHYKYNYYGWLLEKREPVFYEEKSAKYRVTTYAYDKLGNLLTEKIYLDEQSLDGKSGRVNAIYRKYDKKSRLVQVTDNLGSLLTYRYDISGNLIYESRKINEKHQQIRSWSYNKRGKVIEYLETVDAKVTGKKVAKTRFEYDEDANLTRKILPDGSEICYSYDLSGRVVEEKHLEKGGDICNSFFYEYDNAGNQIVIRDREGVCILRKYDFLNRLILETGRNKGTTAYFYSKNGQMEKVITPNDFSKGEKKGIRFLYDASGRMTDMLGKSDELLFHQEYNVYGEVEKQQQAGILPVTFQYDFAGKRIAGITGEQRTELYSYDVVGNLSSITDGNGNTTSYEHDNWGRITSIKKADGSSEQYAYDFAGNIILSVDGNGNEVHYEYNEINRLARIIWQDKTTEEFSYDVNGRLCKKKLRDGHSISYSHNMYGSLTSRRSDGTKDGEYYLYQADGKLKSAIAGGMRYDYEYYEDGSLKAKKASGRSLVSYEYDLNGNITLQKDVTGKNTRYEYDTYDRMSCVYDNEILRAVYDYTAFGAKKRVQLPGISESNYEYDGDAGISTFYVKAGNQLLINNQYRYDGNGNLIHKAGIYGQTSYEYDSLNQLTMETFVKQSENINASMASEAHIAGQQERMILPESYSRKYVYDQAGNRTRMESMDGITEYIYDNCNRLQTTVTNGKRTSFSYDACGNLLSDGHQSYSYDELNRLSSVTTADGNTFVHHYDAEGLRHEVEEDGRLVQFIFNHKRQIITEESSDIGITRYLRGLDLIGSDIENARTYYHYVSDTNGSIAYILNKQSKIENEYQYDAFGNIISSKENIANIFCYCGEQLDAGTAQYYLRARFYNPVIGRFSQQDTYLNDGLNLYAYCQNNPVSFYDPTGHNVEPAIEHPELPAQQTPQYPMVIPQPGDLLPAIRNNDKQLPTLYNNNPLLQMQNSQVQQAVNNAGGNGGKSGSTSPTPGFAEWLNKGNADNKVYFGIDENGDFIYTGITKQSKNARLRQHQNNGKPFVDLVVQYDGLTRNQARAIEQYFIGKSNGPNKLNEINSIRTNHKYYDDARDWAMNFLGVEE